MENIFSLLASHLSGRSTASKFKRYLVGNTGASTFLLSGQPCFHIHTTNDDEAVYFYEEAINGVTFGLIVVNMAATHRLAKAEEILLNYLACIHKPFGIACNSGLETERTKEVISVCDYWRHNDGTDWKVRGSTNGKLLAVSYVKNIADASVCEHDVFLNGFRF